MSSHSLDSIVNTATRHLTGNDREFCQRVWNTDPDIYRRRLQAIGFYQQDKVLDAGCGFGQWTAQLCTLNTLVEAIDFDQKRCLTTASILEGQNISNVNIQQQSIESLAFSDNHFDAIFCYSVIMMTDFRRSLAEFFRVLKPGGKLYVCANGLGFYLHNILEQRNASSHYDPRGEAIQTLARSLNFYSEGTSPEAGPLVIPSNIMQAAMLKQGFKSTNIAAEGKINLGDHASSNSFYPESHYNLENVYEILATK